MYQALYRKWRPLIFEDVLGQQAVIAALKNQIIAGRVGHAYLFTGTRGTGKTTCARIFAKAINCAHPKDGNPCGECDLCRGIDSGTILDVEEIDAASNTGVDSIRELRDETAYTPSMGRYKVYIIDEVHMLSTQAFNALLKILEEPPAHVVFILATTEIHKVLPTILSRCQRYDFRRIPTQDIAQHLAHIAEQEQLALTPGAAELIARLADGAVRDALSMLDTCAGLSARIDEELVRRMTGTADKSYLFDISGALARQDIPAALQTMAELRRNSVDTKRLCEELIRHYRNLMLASLPGGGGLLSGTAPDETERYRQEGAELGSRSALRAVTVLGEALEKMGRGTDPQIELELALFALAAPAVPEPTPDTAPRAFAVSAAAPAANAQPAAPAPQTQAPEAAVPAVSNTAPAPVPFDAWKDVLSALGKNDPGLHALLLNSKAYIDGKRILFECNNFAREYLNKNEHSKRELKKIISELTGKNYGIGPYRPEQAEQKKPASPSAEETMERLKKMGVPIREE